MEIAAKVAVITGGASGLGAANVQQLQAAGAKVAILDVNADAGNALAAQSGGNAVFIHTDVTDADHTEAALTRVYDTLARCISPLIAPGSASPLMPLLKQVWSA
jgi:NAD(P)-dependent dehydrogenase (short-subunit alcohol dehydrogenase family)